MNERERWIVYPLLFFALGASLRDKFLQHVSTKELECQRLVVKQIACEELNVTDPAKPDRIVARLFSSPSGGNADQGERFGVLALFDSEGKELCGVTNQVLQVREINCFGLKVIDPDAPARALAALTSAAAPPEKPGDPPRRFGVLALNNQKFGRLVGVPPVDATAAPSPQGSEKAPEAPADDAADKAAGNDAVGDVSAAETKAE
jgi:hypothetical protein